MDTTYRLRRNVTLLPQDEMARLIDLERGAFFALNGTGARLVQLALEHGPAEAVRRVAEEHGAEEARVRADWVRLVRALLRRGLLEVTAPAPRGVLPGRFGMWLLLTLAWLSLRVVGWTRTLRLWAGTHRRPARQWHAGMAPLVECVDEAVRAVASLHPLSPQCKERAVVAWHLLRNRGGLPAELVVGILAFPFAAHTWVECGPYTVTDERLRCDLYQPAARYQ